MIKIIVTFFIMSLFGCNISSKNKETFKINQKKEKFNSNSAVYLSANYFISKGDVYTASEILNKNLKNRKLLQLKFFSNLASGNFILANKINKLLGKRYNKNSIYLIPSFILNIKEGKYKDSLKIANKNKKSFIFESLTPLIKFWLNQTTLNQTFNLNNSSNKLPIQKLLILENFYDPLLLNDIAEHNYKLKTLNNNDLLFLAGYYFRLNDKKRFNTIIKKRLSDQFDKDYIIKNFSSPDNVFNKLPTLKTILSSKLYNDVASQNDQDQMTISYQKIMLEMSLYLNPDMDISKYSLAEIYNLEGTKEISLKKLESISQNSFLSLANNLKKLSITKNLKSSNQYEELLFKNFQKWPNNKFILYRLANHYKSEKNYLKALNVYKKIIKNYGESNNLLFLYATCLDKVGQWEKAKNIFLGLLEKDSNDTYTLNYISYKLALKDEDLDLAKTLIKRALSLDPNNGFFLDTLGWVEYKKKNYESSVFFLEKSVSLLPKSSEILDHLGDCYLMLGRKKEAIFEWRKALKYETNSEVIISIKEKLKKYE